MTLTTPMKIILALVIIVLIGLGFWLLDWQRKQTELTQEQTHLKELQAQLAQKQQLAAELPQLNRERDELKKELEALVKSKFTAEQPELFVANFIKEVEALVIAERRRTGDDSFDITSVMPGAQTSTAVGGGAAGGQQAGQAAPAPEALRSFPTRPFQLQMKGEYRTLVDFLYQLGALKLERLVTINKIALAPAEKKEDGTPVLTITIPITAYLRQGG